MCSHGFFPEQYNIKIFLYYCFSSYRISSLLGVQMTNHLRTRWFVCGDASVWWLIYKKTGPNTCGGGVSICHHYIPVPTKYNWPWALSVGVQQQWNHWVPSDYSQKQKTKSSQNPWVFRGFIFFWQMCTLAIGEKKRHIIVVFLNLVISLRFQKRQWLNT